MSRVLKGKPSTRKRTASKKTSTKTGASKTGASKTGASKARKAPLATREGMPVLDRKQLDRKQLDRKQLTGKQKEEPTSQVTLKMRQSQHRELARMAFDAGTTMRGVIMEALKAKGLKVTKEDLVDRRRK